MLKMLARFGVLLAAWILVAHSSAGHSQSGDIAIGEQIAARECAGCHGSGIARGVTIQGVFVPSFSEIAGRPNQTRERLRAFVQIPRHPMPAIPLRAQEMNQLIEYILSLKH
jgi:mono/diheme cytochrome c family protein